MSENNVISEIIAPEDAELMIEPKRSCNHCYGRGFKLFLKGDGYKTVEENGYSKRVKDDTRIARPCHCTFRNAKFRLKIKK